jgi:hypothetical protein
MTPCPAAGDTDATGLEAINQYLDAALGAGAPPEMSPEAAQQLDAQRSTGRLERFTQGGGFRVLSAATVELCVTTYERDADGRLLSSDDAVAAVRRGGGWLVVRWVRGNTRVHHETETVTVPFYRSGSTCDDRDFVYAELEVPSRRADSVSAAVGVAVLEVLSGPTGRIDATTAVPQTTRLYSNVIEQGTNHVALLSEDIDVATCEGRAARDQAGEAAHLAAQHHGLGDDEVIVEVFECRRQANGFDSC